MRKYFLHYSLFFSLLTCFDFLTGHHVQQQLSAAIFFQQMTSDKPTLHYLAVGDSTEATLEPKLSQNVDL